MIRTAILGFWHVHAAKYASEATAHSDLDLIAAWDHDPTRGRARAKALGLEYVDELDALLARMDIDAVIVQAATSLHHEVIGKAVRAGKHVFSDKVLAPTTSQARDLVAAAEAAGVVLVTGMPSLHHDYALRIGELIATGKLGDLVNVRMMNCHGQILEGTLPTSFYSAEEACGGALIDMCHIVYLVPEFFGGTPESVFSYFGYTQHLDVEDSAVVALQFANGAHATLEASFVTKSAPRFEIEVNGTEGSVVFRTDSHPGPTGARADHSLQTRFTGDSAFADLPIGRSGPTPMTQWVTHIQQKTRPETNIARALELTVLVEAAYLSAQRHAPVLLSETAG